MAKSVLHLLTKESQFIKSHGVCERCGLVMDTAGLEYTTTEEAYKKLTLDDMDYEKCPPDTLGE